MNGSLVSEKSKVARSSSSSSLFISFGISVKHALSENEGAYQCFSQSRIHIGNAIVL